MDAAREIRRAVDTGEVVFGEKQSEKSILKGEGELIIISANTPVRVKERAEGQARVSGMPIYGFAGSARELGAVCGKPFVVSVMAVKNAGKSKVLELTKQ
ncbi:50S ribosomal protein L30e [Candidatus Micrarchaeota archaeon]|nr:50S ribosomal protein L30e [Candidatus Micrarchaeota archaeon]MBU1939628.1 50S ribosomal protein L30e [Candidatus Micrarchaeota archaeon]